MKILSYKEMTDTFARDSKGEMRDGIFAVVQGLHLSWVALPETGSYMVSMYDARDCHILTDGHRDFFDQYSFLSCFWFDTEQESRAFFATHVYQRTLMFDHHEHHLQTLGVKFSERT